ncbi:MAG: ribbon-helix-helix protein, CopG family [Planctomycetota bacterium]
MKLAVSLPVDLFRELERIRRRRKSSRSALVVQALASWMGHASKEERARRHEEGYRRYPETREEIEAADRAADAVLAEIPWEE